MPIAPTGKMKRLQARWLTGTIRIWNESVSADVNETTGQPVATESGVWTGPAGFHEQSVDRVPAETVVYGSRVLTVKLAADTTGLPATDMRVRITACADPTLIGAEGTVVAVERKQGRAARRFTVNMDTAR